MKNLKNLGKALTKAEQQTITGGQFFCCYYNPACPPSFETSCIIRGGICMFHPKEGVSC
ncbi:hypothetical protein [Psychroserpens sp. NJDZ02]|uniref:hypothetical protein n=1 Tax=Psychroserpens sp. NJDZ02 TaxID=2570561 RepID=UPI0014562E9B|nr:hypothetical protein [Psychroserpens sp. NJDZ02]